MFSPIMEPPLALQAAEGWAFFGRAQTSVVLLKIKIIGKFRQKFL